MADVILTDFEEGPDGVAGPGVSPYSLFRKTGYNLDDYPHEYGFAARWHDGTAGSQFNMAYTNGSVPDDYSPPAFSGEWAGLVRGGHRIATTFRPANAMGLYFTRGDFFETNPPMSSDTKDLVSRVTIGWSAEDGSTSGSVRVDMTFGAASIRERYVDADDNETITVTDISIPAPDEPVLDPNSEIVVWHEWLQFELRGANWFLKIATGATLASGTLPGQGRRFFADCYSNPAPTSSDSSFNPWLLVDNIYGEPGFWARGSAVRLFPRDDGRGMSSAPRIWPPTKSARTLGGYQ